MRIGISGYGSIGRRHARNLIDLGHEVVIFDPLVKTDARNMEELADMCEAVVIASPTNRHYSDITECIGVTHIFCEKPIANHLPGIEITFEKVEMVGYNLRFHSCVKKAKEWLDCGKIGRPIWASFTVAQYNDKPAYLRDGVILNWSHEIDLALYLLGPATVSTSSTGLIDGCDVMSDILLSHSNECQSSVHLDYLTTPEYRGFNIVGTKGRICSDIVRRTAWLVNVDVYQGDDSFDENYIDEIRAFIDRINGKETIGCTGKEALETLKICLEVRKAAGLK